MSFLSPLFLIGALGATIPVAIHLYKKKQTVIYEFAAIDFILQAQNRSLGGTKFRNILLLILRSLLIAFIAMAMAKPFIANDLGKGFASYNNTIPTANVFVIDDSFSMGYKYDGKSLFEIALENGNTILDSLGVNDEVAVIFNSEILEGGLDGLSELSLKKSVVKDRLEAASISHTTTDMWAALEAAKRVLSLSSNEVKRVFVFTDLTENGWLIDDKDEKLDEVDAGVNVKTPILGKFTGFDDKTSIHIMDVSNQLQMDNICISNVEVDEVAANGQREFNVKLTINNFSSLKVPKLTVIIFIDDKSYAQGFIDIDPWSTEIKEFLCKVESDKLYSCRAEIAEEQVEYIDNLETDNVRHFMLSGKRLINLLIVDGDPGVNRYKSESFYLEKVLHPALGIPSNIKFRIMNTSEFESEDLKGVDLLVFCNVESISITRIRQLEQFVANGGAMLMTLGDKVKADYYNKNFANVIPYSLRGINEIGSGSLFKNVGGVDGGEGDGSGSLHFKRPELNKIFYDIFSDLDDNDINSVNFRKIFFADPKSKLDVVRGDGGSSVNASSVILLYSNNLPAIVVGKYGLGTTALFTSSIDRDWNNFPIKPVFLPIIRRLCDSLTGNSVLDGYKTAILVNSEWKIAGSFLQDLLVRNVEFVKITAPNAIETTIFISDNEKAEDLVFSKCKTPGMYRVTGDGGALDDNGNAFVVNVDTTRESNLKKMIKDDFGGLFGNNNVSFLTDVKNDMILFGSGVKRNLWGAVLLMVALIVCAEAFFARG